MAQAKDRQARERARLYQARTEFHRSQSARRRRDNLIGVVVGGLLILAAVGVQTVYFTAGPGAPAPIETPAPVESPAPTQTPEPSDETTPAPSEDAPAPTAAPTE